MCKVSFLKSFFKVRTALLFLIGLCLSGGCAKPALHFTVSGLADINNGLPFYMLVRNVTAEQFRFESYHDVAKLAAQSNPSVLHAQVIYTPRDKPYQASFAIPHPKEGAVGLYFLFTNPTGSWRMLFEPPFPSRNLVTLGPGSIQKNTASTPWYDKATRPFAGRLSKE